MKSTQIFELLFVLVILTGSVLLPCNGFDPTLSKNGAAPLPDRNIPKSGHLYKDSRGELALARARGDATVTLVIAADEGKAEAVAHAVNAAGGVVGYRNDQVGYLRAEMPVDSADSIAEADSVESAAVDVDASPSRRPLLQRSIPRDQTFSSEGPKSSRVQGMESAAAAQQQGKPAAKLDYPFTLSDYPFSHPYTPAKDLGVAELRRNHPTYDGRGITIAQIENAPDLLSPELQSAYTIDGKPTLKVADIRTTIDPLHTHVAGRTPAPWIKMDLQVTCMAGHNFLVAGDRYVPPRTGSFRFGFFDAIGLGNRLGGLSIPKRYQASDGNFRFGVLWDDQTNEVWVDTNEDASFLDESRVTDFHVHRDIGRIGKDDPLTAKRETFAFTVQTDSQHKTIAITVGANNDHATMVATSAAGSRGSEGKIEGVAPGAQLVEIEIQNRCAANLIEALISAFGDPHVDLVLLEQNPYVTSPYWLDDGQFPTTTITTRLIEKYHKPFVAVAGNTPGINHVLENGNVRWGFSVGAYETRDSYLVNRGLVVPHDDNLHAGGSWGPNGVGAIKPDIVVPSGYLTGSTSDGINGVKGLYRLPSGYEIFGGTSQAAPTMAGALAVLMSAATQEKIPYDAESLWKAVSNSARPLSHLLPHQQGNGAVDVGAALHLLKIYATAKPSIAITSRGSVRTAYSDWLQSPNEGVSIFEREGWRVGDKQERVIQLTRTGGPSQPMTFDVSWSGNDGTFHSASRVTLPLGRPTVFPILVNPVNAGAHSAVLSFDFPSVQGHIYRLITTIVASEIFEERNDFRITEKDKFELPVPVSSLFVAVPDDTQAMIVNAPDPYYIFAADPLGLHYLSRPDGGLMAMVVILPMSGTWEMTERLFPVPSIDSAWSTITGEPAVAGSCLMDVSVLGVRVEAPAAIELNTGGSQTVKVNLSNALGAFDGGLAPMAVGASRTVQLTLKQHEQRVFEIRVPDASPLLFAELTTTSIVHGDVDVYLFDCASNVCRPAATSLGSGTLPRLRYLNPKAGVWKIVIDASRVPKEGVMLTYTDVVADPALGAVTVADGFGHLPSGAKWTSIANVWLVKYPESGRRPVALFVVNAVTNVISVPIGLSAVPIKGSKRGRISKDASLPRIDQLKKSDTLSSSETEGEHCCFERLFPEPSSFR